MGWQYIQGGYFNMKILSRTYISNPEYMIPTETKPAYLRGSRVTMYAFQLRLEVRGLSLLPVLPLDSMGEKPQFTYHTATVLVNSRHREIQI